MTRKASGRPATGRTFRMAIYITPLIAKAIRREARLRDLTPGQIIEEAYQSRAVMITHGS